MIYVGGGARSQALCQQGVTSGPMGGLPGPRGPSEEPGEDQRVGLQRGEAGEGFDPSL